MSNPFRYCWNCYQQLGQYTTTCHNCGEITSTEISTSPEQNYSLYTKFKELNQELQSLKGLETRLKDLKIKKEMAHSQINTLKSRMDEIRQDLIEIFDVSSADEGDLAKLKEMHHEVEMKRKSYQRNFSLYLQEIDELEQKLTQKSLIERQLRGIMAQFYDVRGTQDQSKLQNKLIELEATQRIYHDTAIDLENIRGTIATCGKILLDLTNGTSSRSVKKVTNQVLSYLEPVGNKITELTSANILHMEPEFEVLVKYLRLDLKEISNRFNTLKINQKQIKIVLSHLDKASTLISSTSGNFEKKVNQYEQKIRQVTDELLDTKISMMETYYYDIGQNSL